MSPREAAASAKGSVLIVSAFAPELAPLVAWLRGRRAKASGVRCASVGIGLVDAAAGAAAAIARVGPRAVLFVGTAGSYGARPTIGQVAVARRIHLASTAVVRGQGYLPAPMQRTVLADGPLRRALLRAGPPSAATADVATPLAITSARRLGSALAAAHSATVENLEAFAVARAAERAGLPFAAVLGIANRVGPEAHREWVRHQVRATEAACAVVAAWLEGLSTRGGSPGGGVVVRAPSRGRPSRPRRA